MPGSIRITRLNRAEHRCHILPDRAAKRCKPGRHDLRAVRQSRGIGQGLQGDWIEPGSAAFFRQINPRAMRVMGVLRRRLQDAQAGFHPVICRKPLRDQLRQKQIGLAQPFDNPGFHTARRSALGWISRNRYRRYIFRAFITFL